LRLTRVVNLGFDDDVEEDFKRPRNEGDFL
jgi:hypothetical protein